MRRRKGKEALTIESRTEKVSWIYLIRVKGEDTWTTKRVEEGAPCHALIPKTRHPKTALHN